MRVTRYDYGDQFADDVDVLVADIKTMLLSGDYILTPEVTRFEQDFAASLGTNYAVGFNSGTDALVLSLRSLGLSQGDEVITHANTFYATVAAVVLSGATPVLVDAAEASFLIDVDQVVDAITPRTRVILPVHLYGKPTPMARLLALARRHGLHVVEDAAQAHGAKLDGSAAGSLGAIGCFSFHPSKNLAAAGDAGAAVTNDERLASSLRVYGNLGQVEQNVHVALGMNSKLDAIQARVLRHKLGRLSAWIESRNAVASRYREMLAGLPISWQAVSQDETHAYHLFQIRTDRRDALMEHLRGRGIDVVVRYPTPIHLQAPFAAYGWRPGEYPIAERLARELLCLPIRPNMTEPEIAYVVDCVRSFFEGRPATVGLAAEAVQ